MTNCSFCTATQSKGMLQSSIDPDVTICSHCITKAHRTVQSFTEQFGRHFPSAPSDTSSPNEEMIEEEIDDSDASPFHPHQLFERLQRTVAGQQRAKRTLSVAMTNHYYKTIHRMRHPNTSLAPSNLLLVGPTGSGKTLTIRTLATELNAPFITVDATTFTAAGYKGQDVQSIIQRLYERAHYDEEATERGIVYIDEIDTIATRVQHDQLDVGGESVQQALLTLVEGTDVTFDFEGEETTINTSNILFIVGGSFVGLERIVTSRLQRAPRIGFHSHSETNELSWNEAMRHLSPEDIISYGFLPEWVGRFPVMATFDTVDAALLRHILTLEDGILAEYERLASLYNVHVTFSDDSIDAIIECALALPTGARALRSIVERTFESLLFHLEASKSQHHVTIEASHITHHDPFQPVT